MDIGVPGEGIVFLFAKRVTEDDAFAGFATASAEFRRMHPDDAAPVAPSGGKWPFLRYFAHSHHPVAVGSRGRLTRILSDNDVPVAGESATKPLAALNDFLRVNPLWRQSDNNCFLIFWHFPSLMSALILRVQLSGLCFLHAPIVALHYLLNMTAVHRETLDITSFARKHIGDGGTGRYIFGDSGGNTTSILLQLLQPEVGVEKAQLRSRPYNFGLVPDIGPELRRLLVKFGPGVVTSFRLETGLHAPQTSYAGAHTTPLLGLHALILVGVRRDAVSGKHFMLLQNSWASLPFFEVDENYWYSSEAEVCFVATKQTKLRPGFVTNDLCVAESAIVGAGVAEPELVGAPRSHADFASVNR